MAIFRTKSRLRAILTRAGALGQYRIAGGRRLGEKKGSTSFLKKCSKKLLLFGRRQASKFSRSKRAKVFLLIISQKKKKPQLLHGKRPTCPADPSLRLVALVERDPRLGSRATVGAVMPLGGVPFKAIVAPSTPAARAAYRLKRKELGGCATPQPSSKAQHSGKLTAKPP